MSKIAVALSGGIDSAVTAGLLIQQGHEVVGLTAKMTCSPESDMVAGNAKRVADKLGIKHYIFDASTDFDNKVISYFQDSYKNARTPNPCIMCNKYIKWGVLLDYAINHLNAEYMATGHYANIKYNDGKYILYPATDEKKDQLYFLFMLSQDQLSKTLFPLSKYTKSEVKKFAEEWDLPPKSAKESQDICFIKPPLTTKKYLNNIFQPKNGNFVQKNTGKVLGVHNGYWQYTIGQRKGIGIAAEEALYVTGIDSHTNTVYVGFKDELFSNSLVLEHFMGDISSQGNNFEALVKIRYNMTPVRADIEHNKSVVIHFNEPVSGITSGQACVLYDKNDGHLIGGAFIP